MRRVLLLATKDTIALAVGAGYVASGADLIGVSGASRAGVDVVAIDVVSEPGWDLEPTTMLALARRVRAALLDQDFDGVVLTHGLDTIVDTAFLVDLLAGPAADRGGIVLTGASRFLDDPATDGPRNLASALTAAADPEVRGLGAIVCVHDELHAARWARYVDATAPAGFSSAPHPLLGRVLAGRVELAAAGPPRPPAVPGEPAADVALVKTYPGIDGSLLLGLADAGVRGVVLEGTGPGNVPASLLAAINDLTEWGIPVVVTSRSWAAPSHVSGWPCTNLATAVGAVAALELAPEQARVALMVALGAGSVSGVRDWFAALSRA